MTYCGRFAPSPSGRLHHGSLVAGYAALLRCLSRQGRFIVRIEDLDFPRCPAGNTPVILTEMALLGMRSDIAPIVQSHQMDDYHQVMSRLTADGTAYFCECTRALMKQRPCPCHQTEVQERLRTVSPEHLAIRIELKECLKHYPAFQDNNLGTVTQAGLGHDLATSLVLRRADGIIAYNLAVVVDDHNEHISEVVRGADMLDATFLQLCLYEIMGWTAPEFYHVPLITDPQGNKLSKQNKAPAVLSRLAPHQSFDHTCTLLGQSTEPATDELSSSLEAAYLRLGELALECAAGAAALHQGRTDIAGRRGSHGRSRAAAPDFNFTAGSERHIALTNTLLGLGMALAAPAAPAADAAPAAAAAAAAADTAGCAACSCACGLKSTLLPDSGLDADLVMGVLGLEDCSAPGGADGAAPGRAADAAAAASVADGAGAGLCGQLMECSHEYAQLMAQSVSRRAEGFNAAAMPRTAIVI